MKFECVGIGSLLLGMLKPRKWRDLAKAEIDALKGQPARSGHKTEPGKG